jgi:TolA-binding protein
MYRLPPAIGCFIALALSALAAARVWAGPADEEYAIAAGHYAEHRYPAAMEGFRTLIAEHAEHPLAANARFFLAESLLQQGEYAAASDEFIAFAAAHPQHRFALQASFRVGETAYLQGKYEDAAKQLRTFVEAYPRAPLGAYALPYLGDSLVETGEFREAQTRYEQALREHPQGALAGECRLGLARAAEALGDFAEAERFYRFLAEQSSQPLAPEARLRLGMLLYHHREPSAAIHELQPLADAETPTPQRTAAGYWLGRALADNNDAPAAQTHWERALTDDPTHPLAPALALALADALQAAGDASGAATYYERIGRDWPRSQWADDALAMRIRNALRAERWDEALDLVAAFDEQYAESQLHSEVQEMRGRALLAKKDFAAAVPILAALAKTVSPRQIQQQYALVLAQLGAEQHAEALKTIEAMDSAAAPADVQAGLLAARGAAQLGLQQPRAAIEPLQAYLERFADGPDAAKCTAQLCVAAVQTEDFATADRWWRKLTQQYADHSATLPTTLYLAEAAANRQQRELARACFEYLHENDRPEQLRTQAAAGLAWLAQTSREPKSANQDLERLIEERPQSAEAAQYALQRARNFEQLKNTDAALAAYLQLIKEYPQAPEVPDALLDAARLHDLREQDREANELLARLVQEYPDYARLDAALYTWAWVALDLKQEADAVRHFTTLHTEHRESRYWADATYRLADLQVRQRRLREASQLLSELLASAPPDGLVPMILFMQGQAAALDGRWSDVGPPLLTILRDYPQHEHRLVAEYWLAEAEYRTGNLAQAGARLADLSTRIDGRDDAWLPMIPLRRAQVLAHEKNWDEAIAIAETIATQYPDFPQQYEVDYLLGRALGARGKLSEARDAYERVVKSTLGGRTETAAMAQWMIGETYFQQERYDDAIKAYHRCERLFPFERWQAASLLQAGKCHESQGHWSDAIGLYAQVLKQHPETTFAPDAAQRLRVAEQRAATAGQRQE